MLFEKPKPCRDYHRELTLGADRLTCGACPWTMTFRDLPRWIYSIGRMMLLANSGSPHRTELRDALIEAYALWAKEHGKKAKTVNRVREALEKTT